MDGAPAWDGTSLLPTLYLLHGGTDDHTIWQRRTSLERCVSGRRLAVVMPNVNLSFYADMKYGQKYWTFVSQELPETCQRMFRLSRRREDNFVAGQSMGGYGALKLSLSYPERYAAVAALSAGTEVANMYDEDPAQADMPRRLNSIFGSKEEFVGSDNDLHVLARRAAGAVLRPRILLAVGKEDFLYGDSAAFHRELEALGLDVTYVEDEGYGHEWAYWEGKIQQVLDWLPLED